MVDDRSGKLQSEAREALRAAEVAAIPRWYSPILHLCFPSFVGLSVMAVCLALLRDLRAWELLVVPVMWTLANAAEWRIHKYVLHRRRWFAPVLYDRHTPVHHRVFVTEDMAMRDRREYRLVLIPAYGILALFFVTLPLALLMWFGLSQRNVGLLFLFTCMGYTVSYEWLHLSYHLPEESWVGKSAIIRKLRRHHATHHEPALMQRWNFNVTVPLWDWVRGTIYAPGRDSGR